MQVYTLVGKSGSGKSFHAMELCKKNHIEGIIDDGLFIYKNSIVAGVSAKRSQTKIGAVKVALFLDEEVCEQVKEAIAEKQPESILVLGTSVEMVDKIISALGLPMPEADSPRRIQIEEITTEEERETARQQRDKLGKHVIPAPALQLKHNFAGYFMDPLRLLRGKDQGAAAERTVVRPTYSYMGEYYVSEHVMDDIVRCVAAAMPASSAAIIAVSPAFAAFARNVPSPASGITPNSSTSVRSRQMALFAIFFMLFLLLFVFLFLFRPRQLFAADVSCGARPVMSPNGISGTPCAAKGTVSHRRKRFSESSIEFSEEITALLSASPLSSFVLFSPASAESRYSIR